MSEPTRTLSPRQRLRKPAEFRRVFAEPCRVSDPQFTMLARRNGLAHGRLGLAIAKRHVRTAVARNRIKRQVRETFRLQQARLAGLDIVVLARSGAARADRRVLRNSLERLWRRLAERCGVS